MRVRWLRLRVRQQRRRRVQHRVCAAACGGFTTGNRQLNLKASPCIERLAVRPRRHDAWHSGQDTIKPALWTPLTTYERPECNWVPACARRRSCMQVCSTARRSPQVTRRSGRALKQRGDFRAAPGPGNQPSVHWFAQPSVKPHICSAESAAAAAAAVATIGPRSAIRARSLERRNPWLRNCAPYRGSLWRRTVRADTPLGFNRQSQLRAPLSVPTSESVRLALLLHYNRAVPLWMAGFASKPTYERCLHAFLNSSAHARVRPKQYTYTT